MDVRGQLAALAKLAQIDSSVQAVDADLKDIPARIDELRANLARLEGLLQGEREHLFEAEDLFKAQEEEITQKAESLGRSKAKVAKARTMREADAVERELEQVRRSLREREEERENLKAAMEKVRASLVAHEKEFRELQDYFADEEATAARRVKELESKREEVMAGREQVAARIDKPVLRRYDRIRERRGAAVAQIKQGGTCAGCHTVLAPQQTIRVQRAETIEECPRCYRMLYHPSIFGPAPDD